ncbi:MAG: 30S ribosomal protein S3 [Candidatus Heimdallarchaeum endolithica]|uniref:Small ribosomal subunit protein uS3 n=1 Tax=Candidatus Heimdallarchaeum endolithica TaxID=2876572 RepID=A0A9Y1BP27_9ARCH|nr:MAG: 30S ribosomal protein S3 [Candidatus Heimdallarchaeum endolithica]
MPATKDFIARKIKRNAIDEYLAKKLKTAEYGGCEIRRTPLGDRVILRAGRVGLAIGGRGKTIRTITNTLREQFKLDNPQIEVSQVENPDLDARVMAYRLASSLERGRHFRRSAHGIMRRILSAGAKGVEVIISGKITSQRARVETFRAGFVAKCGAPATDFVDEGKATAIIRRGKIGVKVRIMRPDAILPDDIEIIAEPTARDTKEISIGEEEVVGETEIEEFSEELEQIEELDEMAELEETDVDEIDEIDEMAELEEISETEVEDIKKEKAEVEDTKKSTDYTVKEAKALMENMSLEEIHKFVEGDTRKTILKFVDKKSN